MAQQDNTKKEQPEIRVVDEKLFAELYKLHAKKLYQLCFYYIQNREESQELIHDVFKSLWERKEDLEIRISYENYLWRAVKIRVNRHFRDRALRKKHLPQVSGHLVVSENTTENMVMFAQLTKEIDLLLDTLPETTRRIFRLSREQGLSHKEIANMLSLSEKTIEYHITKCIRLLRKKLV